MRPWSGPGGNAGPAGSGPAAQALKMRTPTRLTAFPFMLSNTDRCAGALGIVDTLRGRRVSLQQTRWPQRPWFEVAATVRADPLQPAPGTVLAEGALEGADHGRAGIRGQILVATFAVGAHLEHGDPPRPQGGFVAACGACTVSAGSAMAAGRRGAVTGGGTSRPRP